MIMDKHRPSLARRPARGASLPAATPTPGREPKQIITKSVMFDDPATVAAIETVQARLKGSFSSTCVALLEQGLRIADAGHAPDEVQVGAMPPWLRSAVYEAAKLTGHTPAGVVIDMMGRNMRDYLERARASELEMAGLLTGPPSPSPNPTGKK